MFIDLKLINPALKGTNYLKQAIIYCYNDGDLLYNISTVYEMIAQDNFIKHIKGKNVLWSLESLIDAYEKSVSSGFLGSYFVYYDDSKNLTPKYLIELIVVHLWKTIR